MYIERTLAGKLKEAAQYFPVVTVLGPRQSGKTTLCRQVFPDYTYVNLEDRTAREIARKDPKGFFSQYQLPVVIDEVQRVPELLSAIQVLADDVPRKGQFILTGSHQPQLHAEIAQSLAGRTAILRLLPLSMEELTHAGIVRTRDEYLVNGFLPRLYAENVPADLLYPAYYATYVERDVRQMIQVSNQQAFETFIRLLAGRVGQVVSFQSLAGDVGVSAVTLRSWLSVLESSYIVFRLPCYFENYAKRITKAPKFYFTDVGLAASLLGIETPAQAARDPLLGGLFENLVVVEALKARYHAGKSSPELYHFRIQGRMEVDLLVRNGRQLTPVEIKAGMTFDPSFTKGLEAFRALSKSDGPAAVVYGGEASGMVHGIRYENFRNVAELVRLGEQ